MKRLWMIILLLLMSMPITVFAQDNRGYIRVKMAYDGCPVAGGTVTLYDVTDSPEGVNPLEMLVYVKELGIPGLERQVDESGIVVFDDLTAGLYYLVQHKAPDGFYPIKPFLVRLSPVAGGTQISSIEASPKMEPEKKLPQTGQIVWPAWVLLGIGVSVTGIGLLSWKKE